MRAWFRRLAVSGVCAALAGAVRPACADPVTIRVSEVASGSFANQDFSNRLVTLEAQFDSQTYLDCVAGLYPCDPTLIDGVAETVTVAGLGTVAVVTGYGGVFFVPSSPSRGMLFVGDLPDELGIRVDLDPFDGNLLQPFGPQTGLAETFTSDAICVDGSSQCPAFIALANGTQLLFDEVDQTVTAEIVVGSPVPEPGTWVMVGTGLVGTLAAVRRQRLAASV